MQYWLLQYSYSCVMSAFVWLISTKWGNKEDTIIQLLTLIIITSDDELWIPGDKQNTEKVLAPSST